MCFIDNDAVVFIQEAVVLRLSQENTVRHDLNTGVIARLVCKPHLITHGLT